MADHLPWAKLPYIKFPEIPFIANVSRSKASHRHESYDSWNSWLTFQSPPTFISTPNNIFRDFTFCLKSLITRTKTLLDTFSLELWGSFPRKRTLTRLFKRMESSQPLQNTDHTPPLEPSSPTIGDQRPRKSHRKSTISPEAVPYGGAQRRTNAVVSALQKGIDATVTESLRARAILTDFATQFDKILATYNT